ncbi:MAG: prolyl oligopeptidase family serine peptidase, partial [Bacteroidales bacterium]
ADYLRLVNSYRALVSKPRIILMTPVRCFLSDADIKNEVIQQELRPQIEQLAYEEKLEIINLYHIFGDNLDESMMPDRLHPSSIGAGVMAKHIYGYLSTPQAETPNILRNVSVSSTGNFNFYGFEGVNFDYKESACRLVKPYRAAPGNPWVLRARFWGHEPQTDIALLERGFHIAYCDVADLYGAPKAVKRWNDFYLLMTKAGLNPKVALEGMSRGGLIVYNWAAKNTDKVACIYADAPVMDFKSWPFALYSDNIESDADALKLKLAYKFFSGNDVLKWKKNPVDHAKALAKAKTPILHIVGNTDDVVPVNENTAIFKARLEQAGGKMELISKPEVGHHPHSLNNPEPICRFILKATDQYENLCARPVPGNEFRSGAGWTEGSDWHTISEEITRTVQGKNLKLLMLGNSITQGFGGN